MVHVEFPRPHGANQNLTLASDPSLVRHGFLKSFDGTRIFYAIEGQTLARPTPLVFVYGLVCSSLHWTYQIDYFRRTHQTIWFDYRGHHNSDTPENIESISLLNMRRDLEALFDDLGIKKAVLLGHSMGVNVVLDFCRHNPDRVAAMVLANGTPHRPIDTLFSSNGLQLGFKALKLAYSKSPELFKKIWRLQKGNRIIHSLISLGGFNPYLTPKEDIAKYVDQIAQIDPRIFLKLIDDYQEYDATPWLHELSAPTLVIAGQSDKVVPLKKQELLHQLIPNSELCVIQHGSHCPQMDLPALTNAKIELFLSRLKD